MEGYKITMIMTATTHYAVGAGVRSIEPLVVGEETVDRAYVVTKHDRSRIWYVYDVIEVTFSRI